MRPTVALGDSWHPFATNMLRTRCDDGDIRPKTQNIREVIKQKRTSLHCKATPNMLEPKRLVRYDMPRRFAEDAITHGETTSTTAPHQDQAEEQETGLGAAIKATP